MIHELELMVESTKRGTEEIRPTLEPDGVDRVATAKGAAV